MKNIETKISCGGFFLDDNSFELKNGTLKLKQGQIGGNGQIDTSGFLRADGSVKVSGTIDMDGNNLINITTIGGVHPGNDKIGFENEVDMGQNKIINVGDPTRDMDVTNKQYVDNEIKKIIPSENKPLQLIETIECQAGTFNIERTQTPDGKAYNFEEIQVYAVFPENATSDNLQPRVNAYNGGKNLCQANSFGNIQGNKDTISYGYMSVYQHRGIWEAKSALANGNGWFAPDNLMVNVPPMMVATYPNIDKVEIFCENTSQHTQHDMNGMVFHIYGV